MVRNESPQPNTENDSNISHQLTGCSAPPKGSSKEPTDRDYLPLTDMPLSLGVAKQTPRHDKATAHSAKKNAIACHQAQKEPLLNIMTHPIYSDTSLKSFTLSRLKDIGSGFNLNPSGDKRLKATWVAAILKYQAHKVQLVENLVELLAIDPQPMEAPTKSETVEPMEVPTELIEEETLQALGIEVVDLDTLTPYIIPHGDDRWHIKHDGQLTGIIWTWGDKYLTPRSSMNGYESMYDAIISFFDDELVQPIRTAVEAMLTDRFANAVDYM